MPDQKPLLDVQSYNDAINILKVNGGLLYNRLLAVTMDYGFYIEDKVNDTELYQRRNNVIYRFDCLLIQVDSLQRQIVENNRKSTSVLRENMLSKSMSNIPFNFGDDIKVSSLFDNLLFNSISLFDYLSSFVNYVCSNRKDVRLDWNSLTKSMRDTKNGLSKLSIMPTIVEIHRDFVGKLADHRAYVIHDSADHGRKVVTTKNYYLAENTYDLSHKFLRSFSELKEIEKDHSISLLYGAFWLTNKCIESVDKILMALKVYMENNKKVMSSTIFMNQKFGEEKTSISAMYWNLERSYDLIIG